MVSRAEVMRVLEVKLNKVGDRTAALIQESPSNSCQSAFCGPNRSLNLAAFTNSHVWKNTLLGYRARLADCSGSPPSITVSR